MKDVIELMDGEESFVAALVLLKTVISPSNRSGLTQLLLLCFFLNIPESRGGLSIPGCT